MLDAVQKFFPWASNLPVPAKILISVIMVLLLGLALFVLWSPQQRSGQVGAWPAIKTIDALTRRLHDLSASDRRLLRQVAAVRQSDGVYLSNLEAASGLTRYEVQQRMQALAGMNLVAVRDLTDKNYRIHEDVWIALGARHELLLQLLQ
jgi:hypothetical protein